MTQPPAQPEWSLADLGRILWQRRWLVVVIVAEVLLVAGLVTFLRTPQFRASASVLIEPSTPNVLDSEDVVPVVWNEFEVQRFYETQYLLLRDPAVLREAISRPGIRPALLSSLYGEPAGGAEQPPATDRELAEWLQDQLDIEQQKKSKIVKISFLHEDAAVAADVVNAIVEAYRDFFVTSGIDARQGASTFLEERIEEAQADVLQLEKEFAVRRAEIGSVIPAGGTEIGQSRLEGLDGNLTQAKARRASAEARLSAWRSARPHELARVAEDPRVLRVREDLRSIETELRALEGRAGDAWPRLVELRRAADDAQVRLERAMETVYHEALGAARAELDVAREEESRLARLLDVELAKASETQVDAADFEGLRSRYEQKKLALERLLERREEVALSVDLANVLRRQVTVLDHATPPQRAAVPRVPLSLALGLLLGLAMGVGAALAAEALDNKIRTPDQLQALTSLPVLGSIPRAEADSGPRLRLGRREPGTTPLLPRSQHDMEESFRAIRSALLLAQPDHPPRSLLVTSALPGEGKSTVSANLGRTLASFGQRVLLIDADLRHPRLHRVFDASPARGLTNALASSDADLAELIVPTGFENLWLLPGGPCPPDPATLLDGGRFTMMLADLRERIGFDAVIVDTPPLLVFADAFNIVPLVEGVLLVARALKTPKDAVARAAGSLRKLNAHVIGTILNGEEVDDRSGSYYRYYHYRRGNYGAQRERNDGNRLTTRPPSPPPSRAGRGKELIGA